MSTNSSVTIKHNDGHYHGIYGHWDGYVDGVGQMLHEHYNSQELAEELISLGDFSSLYESIDVPLGHTYDTPVKGHSVFYHRDRGEDWDDTKPKIDDTYDHSYGGSFNYLWDGAQWLVDTDNGLVTIPEAIAKDE